MEESGIDTNLAPKNKGGGLGERDKPMPLHHDHNQTMPQTSIVKGLQKSPNKTWRVPFLTSNCWPVLSQSFLKQTYLDEGINRSKKATPPPSPPSSGFLFFHSLLPLHLLV